jgi:polysaccharide biosynthesis transport protein
MGDTLDLRAYLRPIRHWWWLIAVAVLIALTTGFIYTMSQPSIYRSRATLIVGSSVKDPHPSTNQMALATQLAETYADIARRAALRQITMEALGMSWLPYYQINQILNRPVIEVQVYGEDPDQALLVAQELLNQIILLGPEEEQKRQDFVDQQLTKLQDSIISTQEIITQRENDLLFINSARELARQQTEISALQQKINGLQQNYANLLATTQQGAVNTLRILEPPNRPTSPMPSGLAQNLLAVAALALVLAVAGAFVLEYINNTFRDADELKGYLGITLLGTVPRIPGEANAPDSKLIALQDSQTAAVEAYRRLRTNLQFTAVDSPMRSLLVSSAEVEDGKSLSAANLSIALALAGKSVVLVDADLHRPSQHRLFKIYNHIGVTTALLANHTALDQLLQPTIVPHLSVLTSGPLPPNPAELLGSRRMQELLAKLRERADVVVIDSPPIAAVVDSLILSTQVDGLLMVVRAGKTNRDAVKRSLNALRQVQANVLGIVFSDVPALQMDFYSTKYGYYQTAHNRTSTAARNAGTTSFDLHATPDRTHEVIINESNGHESHASPNVADSQEPANGVTKPIVRRRSGLPWR